MESKELICTDCSWIWEDFKIEDNVCPECGSDSIELVEDHIQDELHPDLPPGNYPYPVY